MSFDILLDWREQFKGGVPPTVAIESKLATLLKKSSKVCMMYEFCQNGVIIILFDLNT